MSLNSTSRPAITGRILSRLPATLQATGGIAVSKENGIWTISPDFSDLNSIDAPSLSDPTSKQIWVYDPLTLEYNVLTLAALGNALYVGTSITSLAIATGSKAFATQTGKDFAIGSFVLATSDANPANYMLGQVASYSDAGLITLTVTHIGGSGTHTDWTLRAASPGGSIGATGPGYSTTSVTSNAIANSGSKTFAVGTGLAFTAGARVRATESAGSTAWMEGIVTAYTGGNLTFTADKKSGTGTFTAWNINLAGEPGADGAIAGSTGSNDNRLLRADGTGGATLQSSAAILDDSGNLSGIGTLDTSGVVTHAIDDAANNAVTRTAVLKHTTSGSPAAGIGVGLRADVETATGENIEQVGALDFVATDIANGTEDFDFVVKLMAAGAAIAEMFRVSSTGVATLLGNAAKIILHAAGGQTLTGGFLGTPGSIGTKSSGTYTPNPLTDTNCPYVTNGGAHTLAPPSTAFASMVIEYTNNGSAGAITTSSFTKVTGDTITTTNGHKFLFFVTKHQTYSHLHVQALQ